MSNNPRKTSHRKNVPRIQEPYVTQVSEPAENGVTHKLSQQFSRTESHILDALSNLDEFRSNPPARIHYGLVPESFRF